MHNLRNISIAIEQWCSLNNIPAHILCDENDLQGIMIFKSMPEANQLIKDISLTLQLDNIHIDARKVRGGTLLVFSQRAMNERTMETTYRNYMIRKISPPIPSRAHDWEYAHVDYDGPGDRRIGTAPSLEAAKEAVDELEDVMAAQQMHRTPPRRSFRDRIDQAFSTVQPKPLSLEEEAKRIAAQVPRCPSTLVYTSSESLVREFGATKTRRNFESILRETLDGIATPTNQQPMDLFKMFANALNVLGQQIGVGSLQAMLKQRGIQWKLSDDKQNIILYVINADTRAPQPITSISSETLVRPSDFEEQLLNIIDFAEGNAPGTFKQKQEAMRNKEQAVREIAKSVGPQSQITQQMQAAPAPAQTPPPAPAPAAAVTQAAMPK